MSAGEPRPEHGHVIVARGAAAAGIILFGLAALAFLYWLRGYADREIDALNLLAMQDRDAAAAAVSAWLKSLFGGLSVFSVVIGAWSMFYARRALRAGVFPPPGAWVVAGRPVWYEGRARVLAWMTMLTGAALALLGIAVAVYAFWLMDARLAGLVG